MLKRPFASYRDVAQRLLAGDAVSALAREYGTSRQTIMRARAAAEA